MCIDVHIDEISRALTAVVPAEAAAIRGEWSTSQRRIYESRAQAGTGEGPFRDATDVRWQGTIECPVPLTGIAFLQRSHEISWAKAGRPTENPSVQVSFSSWSDCADDRATFTAGLAGWFLTGVPVAFTGGPQASVTFGPRELVTGRAQVVAAIDQVAFVVILLQKDVVKMGRNRLWHLRDDLAAPLPETIRRVLTRGRAGVLPKSADR